MLLRCLVEIYGAKHVAMVGDRDAVHAELVDAPEQVADSNRPIKEAVLTVKMKVRKLGHTQLLGFVTGATALFQEPVCSQSAAKMSVA